MNLLKDALSFGPAPTLAREAVCAITMSVITVVFVLWGLSSTERPQMVIMIAALLILYIIVRLVIRIVRGNEKEDI